MHENAVKLSVIGDTIWQNEVNICGVRSDGKASRGILEAVDSWLLSDFEFTQWPTFEKDLIITITITITITPTDALR